MENAEFDGDARFFSSEPKILFLDKFSLNYQNCQLKMELGT